MPPIKECEMKQITRGTCVVYEYPVLDRGQGTESNSLDLPLSFTG